MDNVTNEGETRKCHLLVKRIKCLIIAITWENIRWTQQHIVILMKRIVTNKDKSCYNNRLVTRECQ